MFSLNKSRTPLSLKIMSVDTGHALLFLKMAFVVNTKEVVVHEQLIYFQYQKQFFCGVVQKSSMARTGSKM